MSSCEPLHISTQVCASPLATHLNDASQTLFSLAQSCSTSLPLASHEIAVVAFLQLALHVSIGLELPELSSQAAIATDIAVIADNAKILFVFFMS